MLAYVRGRWRLFARAMLAHKSGAIESRVLPLIVGSERDGDAYAFEEDGDDDDDDDDKSRARARAAMEDDASDESTSAPRFSGAWEEACAHTILTFACRFV
jgi:hypothetical protein